MSTPHSLNLNLSIAGEGETWDEVAIFLGNTAAGWEISGIGRTFLESVASLIEAIEQDATVPPEVKAQLLAGGIQLSVMPWGDGSIVQSNENPWATRTPPTAAEWAARQQGAIAKDE